MGYPVWDVCLSFTGTLALTWTRVVRSVGVYVRVALARTLAVLSLVSLVLKFVTLFSVDQYVTRIFYKVPKKPYRSKSHTYRFIEVTQL